MQGNPRRSRVWSKLTGLLRKGRVQKELNAVKSGGCSALPRRVCRAPGSASEQIVEMPSAKKVEPTTAIENLSVLPMLHTEESGTAPAQPASTTSQPAGKTLITVAIARPDEIPGLV